MSKEQEQEQPVATYIAVPVPERRPVSDLDLDEKISIAVVLREAPVLLAGNRVGDRITMHPVNAARAAQAGYVDIVCERVSHKELQAHGGVDSYLAQNPKKRLMDRATEIQYRSQEGAPRLPSR